MGTILHYTILHFVKTIGSNEKKFNFQYAERPQKLFKFFPCPKFQPNVFQLSKLREFDMCMHFAISLKVLTKCYSTKCFKIGTIF